MTSTELEYKRNYITEREEETLEGSAPRPDDREKWFGTFPYPYMNGPLHLGHAFSMTKMEFTARYQQQLGKNVLFPFGFHCTGMPIYAMARRIANGDPKAKEIAISSGIPVEDVESFSNPDKWLDYFPSKGMDDLKSFRPQVDWRRSFITTSRNPYYDSFVRWQFNTLRAKGLIEFGKRNSIYCLEEGQICADHDRSVGEGVVPIKAKLTLIRFNDEYDICWIQHDDEEPRLPELVELDYGANWVVVKLSGARECLCTEALSRNILELTEISPIKLSSVVPMIAAKQTSSTKKWSYFHKFSGVKVSKWNSDKSMATYQTDLYIPSDYVVSRTGYNCVVRPTEQWYIKYGAPEWRDRVKKHIETMECFNPTVKAQLIIAVDWLKEWGFSREYGLGTQIPWDKRYIIDSLSDSTIYMAYYTVSHLLHSDLEGTVPNLVTPDELSDDFWNAVFFGKGLSEASETSTKLSVLRKEFLYWYPVDLRVSGKDLINNHLIMSLYNHIAIFGEALSPRAYYCNGYITVNKKKMSKSEGNFIILRDAIRDYGISILRLCLADAGDSINDANFNSRAAESFTKHLYSYLKWYELQTENYQVWKSKRPEELNYQTNEADKIFYNQLIHYYQRAHEEYSAMRYKEALKISFYLMTKAKEDYGHLAHQLGARVNNDLYGLFMRLQAELLYPIIPHVVNHFKTLLRDEFALIREFLALTVDQTYLDGIIYLNEIVSKLRNMVQRAAKKKRTLEHITINVSAEQHPFLCKFEEYIKKQIKGINLAIEENSDYSTKKFTFAVEQKT